MCILAALFHCWACSSNWHRWNTIGLLFSARKSKKYVVLVRGLSWKLWKKKSFIPTGDWRPILFSLSTLHCSLNHVNSLPTPISWSTTKNKTIQPIFTFTSPGRVVGAAYLDDSLDLREMFLISLLPLWGITLLIQLNNSVWCYILWQYCLISCKSTVSLFFLASSS